MLQEVMSGSIKDAMWELIFKQFYGISYINSYYGDFISRLRCNALTVMESRKTTLFLLKLTNLTFYKGIRRSSYEIYTRKSFYTENNISP